MPVTITGLGGNYERVIPSSNTVVYVCVGPNMHQAKAAGDLEVGDMVCAFSRPPYGGGVEVESVVVE